MPGSTYYTSLHVSFYSEMDYFRFRGALAPQSFFGCGLIKARPPICAEAKYDGVTGVTS